MLVDSLSLEWQQTSSDLQDCSQYSDLSQQFSILDRLDSSFDFLFPLQAFVVRWDN